MKQLSLVKILALKLGLSFSVHPLKFDQLVITDRLAAAQQMRMNETKDQKNYSGSATPNSTQSQTPLAWALLSMAVLCSLLTLLAWIAQERLSKLESLECLPATQERSFSSDGLNTPVVLNNSLPSAKLIM